MFYVSFSSEVLLIHLFIQHAFLYHFLCVRPCSFIHSFLKCLCVISATCCAGAGGTDGKATSSASDRPMAWLGRWTGGQVVVVTVIRSVTDTSSGERGGMGFGEEAWALSLTVVRDSDRD